MTWYFSSIMQCTCHIKPHFLQKEDITKFVFVCLVCGFTPQSTAFDMSRQSVNQPFLNQWKEENDRRKYFINNRQKYGTGPRLNSQPPDLQSALLPIALQGLVTKLVIGCSCDWNFMDKYMKMQYYGHTERTCISSVSGSKVALCVNPAAGTVKQIC